VLLLLLLVVGSAARAAAQSPAVVASALLVFDPQPSDPCSRSPSECGPLDACASALRVDVLGNGTALLTPAGADYTLSCPASYERSAYAQPRYGYDPSRWPARGEVQVKCSAMFGSGAEGAWPPAKGGNSKGGGLQPGQRRALVFDGFAAPSLRATRQGGDGRPYGDGDGTVSHSLLGGPDAKMTSSALFNRRAFHSALCFPFSCPTPGCSLGRPSALVLIEAPQTPGSGRVLVRSAERQGTCQRWSDDHFCGRELAGYTYRVAEGGLLGERAAAAAAAAGSGGRAAPCPPGTGPAPITVPAPPIGGLGAGDVKPGLREGVCVSACDGGGQATASSSAIAYAFPPPQGACRSCPVGYQQKGGACASCAGWAGPCCAPGSATSACPPCPAGVVGDKKKQSPSVRLRLASIVSPRPGVSCEDFFRAGAADLAAATFRGGYLDAAAAAKAAAGCPPRELALSVDAGSCGVVLSSRSCPMLDTVRPTEWAGPGGALYDGVLGTLPLNLTAAAPAGPGGGPAAAAAAARSIQRGLVTRFATGQYMQEDQNVTVAALEASGPGGRGLLALRLSPVGCVFRYAAVDGGALPGGGDKEAAAAAGQALPASARYCPGTTTKSPQPAKLDGGDPVPVCVMKQ
jgi:hypothetical protein